MTFQWPWDTPETDPLERLLESTECHFRWDYGNRNLNNLRTKLQYELRNVGTGTLVEYSKWTLRLTLSYVFYLFGETDRAIVEAERAIRDLLRSHDDFTSKHVVPFKHIAYSLLITLKKLEKNVDNGTLFQIAKANIRPLSEMSDPEKGGLYGMKACILRLYGSSKDVEGRRLLRRAVKLDPDESEWKISLICNLTQSRRHLNENKGTPMTLESVQEEMRILEFLRALNNLSKDDKYAVLNYSIKMYADLIKCGSTNSTDKNEEYRNKIIEFCFEILSMNPRNPKSFVKCAEWFLLYGFKEVGFQILEYSLLKHPDYSKLKVAAIKALQVAEKLVGSDYNMPWHVLYLKVLLHKTFDDVEFFNNIFEMYPENKSESLNATVFFYLFQMCDVVKAATHLITSIKLNPQHKDLREYFSFWMMKKVDLLETTYEQATFALNAKTLSPSDENILKTAKQLIENSLGSVVSQCLVKTDLVYEFQKQAF